MSKVVLLVGTRKGLFVLDSEDRKSWRTRGPFCESWPVYHAIYDDSTGTIYVAAGSEWHGAAVWRSSDLGETWAWSGEGLKLSCSWTTDTLLSKSATPRMPGAVTRESSQLV